MKIYSPHQTPTKYDIMSHLLSQLSPIHLFRVTLEQTIFQPNSYLAHGSKNLAYNF